MGQSPALSGARYARLPDINGVQPLSPADYDVLGEVRAVLERHNALDRFGISLLHKHFDLAEDELLVEYTDAASRTQTLRVEKADAPLREGEGLIETNWVFNHPSAPVKCIAPCKYYRGNHY